ncbi:MAG TPA: hypothetical protein VK174_13855 [Chitinophagales bacterium]|nr:hypothetical protein [Chitinophagales bacterium]
MKPIAKNKEKTQAQKVKPVGHASQLSIAFGVNYMEVEIDIESFIMG